MSRFKAISELCNVVSLAAYCSDDSSMLMTLENVTSELWIPSVRVQEGESWQSVLNKELQEVYNNLHFIPFCFIFRFLDI